MTNHFKQSQIIKALGMPTGTIFAIAIPILSRRIIIITISSINEFGRVGISADTGSLIEILGCIE